MKEEFDKEVNEEYSQLTEQEKDAMFKRQKKISFIVLMVLSLIYVAAVIYLIISVTNNLKKDDLILGVGVSVFVFIFICSVWVVYLCFFCRKKTIEKNKEMIIKNILKNRRININEKSSINGKKIKKAKIIDAYTEYSDKLHAILDYQEIIQYRMYKFLVTFEDGSTGIYTTEEGEKLYNKLIVYVEKEDELSRDTGNKSSAEEILKYKQLLDEGVITQEEYERKKQKLLDE